MITNELKINYSHTEFLILSPRTRFTKDFKYLVVNLKSVHLLHVRGLGLHLMIILPWMPIFHIWNIRAMCDLLTPPAAALFMHSCYLAVRLL